MLSINKGETEDAPSPPQQEPISSIQEKSSRAVLERSGNKKSKGA
jgi:hypothetical protein